MNGLLTVAREYENRLNLCTLLQAAPDAVLHLKIPFEDRHTHKKKAPVVPLRCHSGYALCRRQTDRCCGQSTSQDWRTRPAIRICAHQRKDPGSQCSARLLNHRNYFQRQPEHVEDKFMHHNRKKKRNQIYLTSSRF